MKIYLILSAVIITAIVSSCQPSTHENEKGASPIEQPPQQPHSVKSVTIKTFANDSLLSGFGYDIYMDSATKPTVHQPNIPAVAGNRGFATEKEARKIGEYVGNKIKNNIMPPSVTTQELDSLGVK